MINSRPATGSPFLDLELSDHWGNLRCLSDLAGGDPLLVQFYRGFWCPKEQAFFRKLVGLQDEAEVAYTRFVSISVDPPAVAAAFRAGLGAPVTPPRLLEPLPPSGATPLRKCSTIRFAAYSGPSSCTWSKVSSRTCLPQSGRSSSATLAAPGLGTALRLDLWRFTTASRQPGL